MGITDKGRVMSDLRSPDVPAQGADAVRTGTSESDTIILPPGGIRTVMDAVHEALDCLSMTQCPYYLRGEKCNSGCHVEPACQTDEPLEGWVKAALTALEGALPEPERPS